ncbi:MAG: YbdK family carboxylate-amine ligase [Pirellulaceae bacterium]
MRVKPESDRWRGDDLAFQPSARPTLGVELELQILDRESGDLAPGAVRILEACREESLAGASAELMQTMIEIKTGVCADAKEVQQQLVPQLRKLRNLATSMGYELALSGTHPFHRMGGSVVFPDERYKQIQGRLAWMIHQRVVFGMHIHVGVPTGEMAIGIINVLVQYLPHLLALSANSPFWQGIDTGLASCRTALYRSLPHAGVPRYFPHWKDFRTFLRVMRDCRAIESPKDIYWDIRPRPELGTIEFRVCDMPADLSTVLGIVALTRSLVVSTRHLLEERPHLRRGDMRRHWIAVENKWLATRYGMGAMYIRTPGGKRRPLAHDVNELISRLLPFARETGDATYLGALQPVEKFESGAAWQRRVFRESGDWRELMRQLTARLANDLDSLAAGMSPSGRLPPAGDGIAIPLGFREGLSTADAP